MRITNSQYFYQSPAFKTTDRRRICSYDKSTIYNYTKVEREDLNFKELSSYIIESFKNSPKVSIYSMACSDGSEGYTLAMHLLEELKGENFDKFFPIKCTDNDFVIINSASHNKLNMESRDLEELSNNGIDYKKYFTLSDSKMLIPNDKLKDYQTYDIKNSLVGALEFCQKTILQQVAQMDPDATKVVLCRNILPYVGDLNDEVRYINEISKKLKVNDILVIGDYDRGRYVIEALKRNSFIEKMNNVFVKLR